LKQTLETRKALERDRWLCQWCYYKHNRKRSVFDAKGKYDILGGGHHIFGRARVDDAEAIIGLCAECHTQAQKSIITKCEIIELMEKFILGYPIREKYRKEHDC
jgi:hypothetical protein